MRRWEVEDSGSWARDKEVYRLEQGMREEMQQWLLPLLSFIKKKDKKRKKGSGILSKWAGLADYIKQMTSPL